MGTRSDVDAVLDEVARGRTEAFGGIVRTYALPLRSYLASQVHHLDDVDDLAQEVFLASLGSLSSFRRGDDFGAWLRGIARNKVLLYFRSESRRHHALDRKSTRLNSSHSQISYAVFCLKKKKSQIRRTPDPTRGDN